jgi:CubicO group peptidase (beta-lactamase class C family)
MKPLASRIAAASWRSHAGVLAVAGFVGLAALVALVTCVALWISPSSATRTVPESRHWFVPAKGRMEDADFAVRTAVADRQIPGATVAVGHRGQLLELAGYGRIAWSTHDVPASPDSTLYDLASLTKGIATTTAVLLLVQDGTIQLDDPVQRSLREFRGRWKERVTWRHLLTHTSGLPPAGHIRGRTGAARLASVLREPLTAPPGDHVEYSDLGFIVLWTAAQRAAREPLPRFLARRVWNVVGMTSTSFSPGESCVRCAPTLTLRTGKPYRGKPSDPIAQALDRPTGNAGLFSTAHDVARFVAMIAAGGAVGGVRVLRPDLVRALFQQVPGTGHRTLGWEAFCPDEHLTQQQPCQRPVAYGHVGWTGTSFWIDPERGAWVVLLSNSTYDVRNPKSLDDLRAAVFARVAEALRAEWPSH